MPSGSSGRPGTSGRAAAPGLEAASGARSHRAELVSFILEQILDGTAPWLKPWKPALGPPPFNPVTGGLYKGVNRMSLQARNRRDPRWMSFGHLISRGLRPKKGASPSVVEFWQWGELVTLTDPDGMPLMDSGMAPVRAEVRLTRPRVRYFHVFNLLDVEDMRGMAAPAYVPRGPSWNPLEKAEELIAATGAVIAVSRDSSCFYSHGKDVILTPARETFRSPEEYCATLLHELAHWTSRPERLGRRHRLSGQAGYAREELRAEMASWMLAMDLGLEYSLNSHLSYVSAWARLLRGSPYDELFKAAADAERIRSYLLGFIPGFRPDYRDRSFPYLERDGEPWPDDDPEAAEIAKARETVMAREAALAAEAAKAAEAARAFRAAKAGEPCLAAWPAKAAGSPEAPGSPVAAWPAKAAGSPEAAGYLEAAGTPERSGGPENGEEREGARRLRAPGRAPADLPGPPRRASWKPSAAAGPEAAPALKPAGAGNGPLPGTRPSRRELREEPGGDAAPAQSPPLPLDGGLSLPDPVPARPGAARWLEADPEREVKPRAVLMNSFFGILLRPGFMGEQIRRWDAVRQRVREARARPWTRTYEMADFLGETDRVARLARIRAWEDSRAPGPWEEREIAAYNAVLAVLDAARALGMPGLLLPPARPGGPALYAGESLVRRKPREAEFPLALGGKPVQGWRPAAPGEAAPRHAVVNLDNREILAVFRTAAGAADFAESLNSPELRLMGGPEALPRERARLFAERRMTEAPRKSALLPAPPPLPEELAASLARLKRAGGPGRPREHLTLEEARNFAWLKESGAWQGKHRPVTFGFLPEEMRLGHWGEREAQWMLPRLSELPPLGRAHSAGAEGEPRSLLVPLLSEDPLLRHIQTLAMERVKAGPRGGVPGGGPGP
ncbi:MAG: ssDNA-binding domain-containing protein, partial [Deltaproteobacteria bacterium]|nr:ssDNA-binding domain-containing protein [Deltaproteobacteria bacterium]